MADTPTTAPAATPAPAAAPTTPPVASGSASSTLSGGGSATPPAPKSPVPSDPIQSPSVARDAANEARTGKPIQRQHSTLITNPPPVVDPDVPVKEELPSVPQSTLDEMAAGRKALERNKPVATALENARTAKDAGVSTAPETNPVDATHTLQQQGKV